MSSQDPHLADYHNTGNLGYVRAFGGGAGGAALRGELRSGAFKGGEEGLMGKI